MKLARLLRTSGALLLSSIALLDAPAAVADEGGASDRGAISFVFENDVFVGTDRNYTNGLLLTYLSPERPTDSIVSRVARVLLRAPESARQMGSVTRHRWQRRGHLERTVSQK